MPNILVCLIIGLYGLIFGSFISALVPRLHDKKNWFSDRSRCDNCEHILAWYDLVPLFSYIFTLGKCRYCKKKVSIVYPVLELTTALAFVLLYTKFNTINIDFVLYSIVLLLLLILSWYDFFYHEVLDFIALPLIAVLVAINISNPSTLITTVVVMLAFSLIVLFSNGMGGGDIRIAAIAALLTGWPGFVVAFEAAVLSALIYGLLISFTKHKNLMQIRKTAVPLIPFFTIGILMAWLYGDIIVKEFLKI